MSPFKGMQSTRSEKGLEISITTLEYTKVASDSFRLDSKYFHSNKLLEKMNALSAPPLESICEWITQGPNPNFTEDYDAGIPCLTGRNIRSGIISIEGSDLVTQEEFLNYGKFKLNTKDVLITLKGAGSTGKVARVEDNSSMMFSRNIGLIRPRNEFNHLSEYIYIYSFRRNMAKNLLIEALQVEQVNSRYQQAT